MSQDFFPSFLPRVHLATGLSFLFAALWLSSCNQRVDETQADDDGIIPGDETTGADDDDDDVPSGDDGDDDDGDDDDDVTDDGGDDVACGDPDQSETEEHEDYDFSIIWVANSGEGTVSKIDTRTATELARYKTGATANVDPSRTSVNSIGEVAVVNRTGSMVKIAPRPTLCHDRNKNGTIETSSGPTDVLPWGEDECVLWDYKFDFMVQPGSMFNEGGPRAVAWEIAAETDPCAKNSRVWVAWRDQPSTNIKVQRLTSDGMEDGETELTNWSPGEWGHGPYGGIVDAEGNFWVTGSEGSVVRIDGVSFESTTWTTPLVGTTGRFYGMSIDGEGNIWIAGWEQSGLYKFDIETHQFSIITRDAGSPDYFRGLVVDREYQLWVATHGDNESDPEAPCGLAHYDIAKKKWAHGLIALPNCKEPVGVSVDSENFIWAVDREAQLAYKVDRTSFSTQTVSGLVKPYTYSDMTGAALHLVEIPVDPPE
jgi:DNA-binding beta-propeller fold protein YncE